MTKKTLTATLPDGTVATRTTARDYTHVVAVNYHEGYHADTGWGALAWSSSEELALREYGRWSKARSNPSVRDVPSSTELAVVPVN